MNLQQSMAVKRAGNQQDSSVASKVQKIRNKTGGTTPGKTTGSASVDKTVSQF